MLDQVQDITVKTRTGTAHNDHTPPIQATVINLAVTHHIDHIIDHPHIGVLQLTNPEITVDHTHD